MGLLLLLGGSDFSGALDTLGTGLESAWSVGRRLRTGYTSNIIRVRRSSDNTESDFGYLANGAVDVAAVAAFCGAGDGFLTTVYDQSGSGRNLIQTTTTRQPQVVSSGTAVVQNSRLVAAYDGSTNNRRLFVNGSASFYNALHTTGGTVAMAVSVANTASSQTLMASSNGSVAGINFSASSTERLEAITCRRDVAGVATNGATVTASATSRPISATGSTVFVVLDPDNATAGNRAFAWIDGTAPTGFVNAQTATPFIENAFGNLAIGNASTFDEAMTGNFAECVIWSGDRTAGRATWESSAKTFWGTP